MPRRMPELSLIHIYLLRRKQGSLLCKRLFDILASLVLLVLLSPVFLVLAIAIKLDSHGPVFYLSLIHI